MPLFYSFALMPPQNSVTINRFRLVMPLKSHKTMRLTAINGGNVIKIYHLKCQSTLNEMGDFNHISLCFGFYVFVCAWRVCVWFFVSGEKEFHCFDNSFRTLLWRQERSYEYLLFGYKSPLENFARIRGLLQIEVVQKILEYFLYIHRSSGCYRNSARYSNPN